MKIAFVSLMTVLPWGGSEDLWYKAAKLALEQGHEVYSVAPRWSVVPERIAELKRLGATTDFYYEKNTSLVGKVARKLKVLSNSTVFVPAIEADIYIISNGSTWDFIRFREIAEHFTTKQKPYILISQHGFENGDIVRDADRAYAIDIIKRASNFLFVAQRNLDVAERQLAAFLDNASIISNPLNTTDRAIKPYPQSSALLMACVARLDCAIKGQDILLQALSNAKWVKRDFKLKLYGTGPHSDYLQKLIELYNLQDKVTLEGHVRDVDSIWETNQVLILTSFNEGTPLSLLEAMMAGRAALATDVGDNGRYVLPNSTGVLVATASVNSLNNGLEELWESRDKLEEMGRKAFQHAQEITDLRPESTLLKHILAAV